VLKYWDQHVCMCVCLSVHLCVSKTARPNFTKFCVRVTCGLASVLLWRQYDTLCITGFVHNVMFSHNAGISQNQRRRIGFVQCARWRYRGKSTVSDCIWFWVQNARGKPWHQFLVDRCYLKLLLFIFLSRQFVGALKLFINYNVSLDSQLCTLRMCFMCYLVDSESHDWI